MTAYLDRIVGAARLDVRVFEEVEADRKASLQAMGVVIVSNIAATIGALGLLSYARMLTGLLVALTAWLVWAGLTYWIGTRLLPERTTQADWGQLLRTTGFSASPGILRILGIVSTLTAPIFFLAQAWMLIAFVVAVRQALDFTSTWRALLVCGVGWIAYTAVFYLGRYLLT